MEPKQFFGIFVILMGVTTTVLNLIIMSKIKNTCKEDTTIRKSNMGNLVLGITLGVIGFVIYTTGGGIGKTDGSNSPLFSF
jgi:hypothetical protein